LWKYSFWKFGWLTIWTMLLGLIILSQPWLSATVWLYCDTNICFGESKESYVFAMTYVVKEPRFVYVSCYLKPNICLLFLKKWNKNCEEPQTFWNFSIYHLTFVDWTEKNSSVISLFIYNRPSPDFHCFESHFDNGTRYIFQ